MSEKKPQQPRSSGKSNKTGSRRKRRSSRPPILIKPGPDEAENRSLLARLKREAPFGAWGLGVSLALHLLLLMILAIMVVNLRQPSPPPTLEVGWLIPDMQPEQQRPRGPVQIEAFQFEPDEEKEEQKPPPKKGQPEGGGEENSEEPPKIAVRPAPVEEALSSRNPRLRQRNLSQHGGDDKTLQAIVSGLSWLRRQQQDDGRWQLHAGYPDAGYASLRTDTGATALALLAFLGAGHTHLQGDHREVIDKGLRWLKQVQKQNGDLHDHRELGRQTAFYAHSQGTIAICEAYALTGDESLREPAEQAVLFLLESQHPENGGWKYQPQTERTMGDLSVTGWGLMALHTARMAGIEVPQEAYERASIFLDSVQESRGARYKYMPRDPAERISPAMTAEGLLCRQWLGWPKDHPPLKSGIRYLMQPENLPEWSSGRRNLYYWYYALQVLHNVGGEEWQRWYRMAHDEIVDNQLRSGSTRTGHDVRGSWDPANPPGAKLEYAVQAGRLYLTSLCLLALETPLRHHSVYAAQPNEDDGEEARFSPDSNSDSSAAP